MGVRSVGGRGGSLPGTALGRRARPRCPAAHLRRFAGRPMTRLRSPSARTWPTPAVFGSRASAASTPCASVTEVSSNALTGGSGAGRDRGGGLVVDRDQAEDLVLAGARGHLHFDDVAFLVVEEALPDRGRRRDLSVGGIRFLGGDDLIGDGLAGGGVLDLHRRPEADLVVRDLVEVHARERGQPAVELADPRLQVALPLLGRLVLGVFTQVAVLPRALDLLRQRDLQLVVEGADLLLELLLDLVHSFPVAILPP